MKKTKVFLVCLSIIAAVLSMGIAPAYSSGHPVLGIYVSSDISAVVVAKFDSSFTTQDVDSYTQALSLLLPLPGMVVYGPSELAQVGSQFADADYLANFIMSAYPGVVDMYVFLDVTKVNSAYSSEYGPNVRMDAVVNTVDGSFYVGSLEVPEAYLSMFVM